MNTWLSKLARAVLVTSPPFVLAIAILALSVGGVIALDERINWRSVLAANLVLYWAITAIIVAAVRDRRAVARFCRSHRVQLAMAAVSVGVSIVFAEFVAKAVVARTHGWYLKPSANLHHVNPPGVSVRDNTGSLVTINDDGFRTSWTRDAFHGQRERIAVMGDSFTFGLGVNDDESAPYVLEHVLRSRLGREDIGVLNAGVISWSPLIERNAFRELVRDYRPTVTLLMLDLTDIGDDYRYALDIVPGSDPAHPRFVTDDTVHSQGLALVKLAEPLLAYLKAPFVVAQRFSSGPAHPQGVFQFELDINGTRETNFWFVLRHPLEATRHYFEQTLAYIRDIAREVEASGSKFVLVVTPRYWHWNDLECPDDWSLKQRGRNEPHEYAYFEFFDEVATRESFPIFSLLPAFQATKEYPLVLRNDAHWNPAGNRFVAERLADYLLENGLVK